MAMNIANDSCQSILQKLNAFGVQPSGVSEDSRRIEPNDLFLGYCGAVNSRPLYIADAVRRGACAVLWQPDDGFSWPLQVNVPNVAISDLRQCAGELAYAVYERPCERISLIAITGTNGKSSIAKWLADAYPGEDGQDTLDDKSTLCASIGTLGAGFAGQLESTGFTTPEAPHLMSLLHRYAAAGAKACALEASSIGISEGRLNGVNIDSAVFTNCTRDHLDYHGNMQAYIEAKKRLFLWPHLRHAIINLDDPVGQEIWRNNSASKHTACTTSGEGLPAGVDMLSHDCVLRAADIVVGRHGQEFTLSEGEGKETQNVSTQLIGRYNVANLLAVAAVLRDTGLSLQQTARRLEGLQAPPGRMQCQVIPNQPMVVVDYAHTPDALDNALLALRELAQQRRGQLMCVFGCGGERDQGKRPLMGAVAARRADLVWVTSDNPRSEDPLHIIEAVCEGSPAAQVEVDRRRAIRHSIAAAAVNDVLLIAGKGHETYQEIAGQYLPFSDYEVAREALLARQHVAPKGAQAQP